MCDSPVRAFSASGLGRCVRDVMARPSPTGYKIIMRTYVTVSAASAVIISITLSSCSYLENHRALMGHDSTYEYQQVGRVEFFGPFPLALLQTNRAYFLMPEDAAIAQESTQPVLQQPIIAQNGTVIYPPLQPGRMRTVRIAHSVSGFVTQEPPPSWTGTRARPRTAPPSRRPARRARRSPSGCPRSSRR